MLDDLRIGISPRRAISGAASGGDRSGVAGKERFAALEQQRHDQVLLVVQMAQQQTP